MTVSDKKQLITKLRKTKINTIQRNKQQRFLLYHKENVGKYEFFTDKYNLPEKNMSKKAATIKRFECS